MIIINNNTVSKPCNNHSGHVDKNVFDTLFFSTHYVMYEESEGWNFHTRRTSNKFTYEITLWVRSWSWVWIPANFSKNSRKNSLWVFVLCTLYIREMYIVIHIWVRYPVLLQKFKIVKIFAHYKLSLILILH